MITGRFAFGLGHINQFIYVVGGVGDFCAPERGCERFDVLKNKWILLGESAYFDEFVYRVSLVAV